MSSDLAIEAQERKMYITIDLDKFPGLKADVDESVRFAGSGRVCSVRHDDYCNEMQVEVTTISLPSSGDDGNDADKALGKLKTRRSY